MTVETPVLRGANSLLASVDIEFFPAQDSLDLFPGCFYHHRTKE